MRASRSSLDWVSSWPISRPGLGLYRSDTCACHINRHTSAFIIWNSSGLWLLLSCLCGPAARQSLCRAYLRAADFRRFQGRLTVLRVKRLASQTCLAHTTLGLKLHTSHQHIDDELPCNSAPILRRIRELPCLHLYGPFLAIDNLLEHEDSSFECRSNQICRSIMGLARRRR